MKILLIYATAGAGHLKAAQALYKGFKNHTNHDVVLVDSLDYTSPLIKKLYSGTYSFLVSKIPKVWGAAFALLDIPSLQPVVRAARRIYNQLIASKLHRYLQEERFDWIISTQFMSGEVACALKRSGRIESKIITVVTDFDVHRIWVAEGMEGYAAASDWTKIKLQSLGVEASRILVSGVSTDEQFSEDRNISVLKTDMGFIANAFTVLIATGSFGMGPIEELIRLLDGIQVIVVCGHNKGLLVKLSRIQKENVKVLGLVNNMPELMAVADVMVTKPGGLSISEALVSQLPMIFFSAIPGQETNNIKVLKEYGVGISNCSVEEIVEQLKQMKFSSKIFADAVEKTKSLARPNAVKDIIEWIEDFSE